MLEPSGGGLILYQAYGNLYAMTGERMVLPDNPLGSPNNVLNNQIFDTLRNDSFSSNVEMYFNDEEDNGVDKIIPQSPSKEIRTKIDNTKCPPSLLKKIREDEI
nr:hypothetical protein [Tanacetum cinerariifolium]